MKEFEPLDLMYPRKLFLVLYLHLNNLDTNCYSLEKVKRSDMQQKSENKLLGGVTQQKKTSSILKKMSGQRNEKPELEEISVLCNASLLVNWKQNHRHIRIQG